MENKTTIGKLEFEIRIRPKIDIKLWDIIKIKMLGKHSKKVVDTIVEMLCSNIKGEKR